jgi:urea transport system ATP-binding protein
MLKVENIDTFYGAIQVCNQISLEILEGEIVCILGRNGVGKTTLLKSIMRILPYRFGSITFNGQKLDQLKTYQIARMGISYVPQGRQIFPSLTVLENLKSGTISAYGKCGVIPEEVYEYFPILMERRDQKGGSLSGGEQQMLAIGRALAGKPRLVLLDEPSEGIQPNIVDNLKEIIRQITNNTKISFLLVEQNLKFALDISKRGYIMSKGQIVVDGPVKTIASSNLIKQYLTI